MARPTDHVRSDRLPGLWFWLSAVAALLAAAGSVVGLVSADSIYGRETTALADAAAAQDIANLLVAPLLVVLGARASRGSLRAWFGWSGCVAFTTYNYAIYAFSVQFGPLFPVWVAVLGLSAFALAGGVAALGRVGVEAVFAGRAVTAPAWFLVVVGVLFGLLWLSEIGPDLLAGGASRSASAWDVPTNPVHVLDLALFLPAVVTSGVLVLRRRREGYATAGGALVFVAATCLPIVVTPFVANARGHEPGWAVLLPIGAILIGTLVCLAVLLRPGRVTGPASVGPPAAAGQGRVARRVSPSGRAR